MPLRSMKGRGKGDELAEKDVMVSIVKLAPELKGIFGKPCWDTSWYNYGSLSFKVGKPRLEIEREPDQTFATVADIRNGLCRRVISVDGDWQFRLQFCRWRVLFGDTCVLRGSAKPKELIRFAMSLKGQRLLSMMVDLRTGKTILRFDLNTTLEIVRDQKKREVMWYFFGRGQKGNQSKMWVMYSDGAFSDKHDDFPKSD